LASGSDNVIWAKIDRRAISADGGLASARVLLGAPVTDAPLGDLLEDALGLSVACRVTVYDSLYLALACRIDARFVTADYRLVSRLLEVAPNVGERVVRLDMFHSHARGIMVMGGLGQSPNSVFAFPPATAANPLGSSMVAEARWPIGSASAMS
jgi:hypothetical protein